MRLHPLSHLTLRTPMLSTSTSVTSAPPVSCACQSTRKPTRKLALLICSSTPSDSLTQPPVPCQVPYAITKT